MTAHELDTTQVANLIHIGDINFSDSDTNSGNCKTYAIETTLNDEDLFMRVENCETQATILSFTTE